MMKVKMILNATAFGHGFVTLMILVILWFGTIPEIDRVSISR